MVKGKRRVGVSVSHLRSPATPCLIATATEGGWKLTGSVSWVSGYHLFDSLVVGFFCPEEGLEGLGVIRFKRTRSLKISKVLKTVALSSMQTVSLEFKEYFLPEENSISLKPIGSYGESSDPLAIQFVNLSALARGFLREMMRPELELAYEACRAHFFEKGITIELYAEMNRIATILSYHARFSSGTRSVICPNAIERRCRELMLFSVILPSKKIMEACAELLVR